MTGAEIVAAMMWERLAVIGVVFVALLLLGARHGPGAARDRRR